MQSLLPYVMRDTNNLALESCIQKIFDIDPKAIMINPLENADEKLLEYLAKEYHILGCEGWNLAKTIKQKQNLIVNSLVIHAQKGSIPSIVNALKNLNINAEISEFYEYGGRPGHYIVKFLNLYEQGLTEELEKLIKDMIACYAPKSRILDYINYFLSSLGTIFITSRIKTIENTVITTKEVIL